MFRENLRETSGRIIRQWRERAPDTSIKADEQELLNLLADSMATAKILLLVNYRPECSHPWNSKTYYIQLRLDPLGKESAEEMLSALLGDGKDLIPHIRLIIERTEGTPFFMEECRPSWKMACSSVTGR